MILLHMCLERPYQVNNFASRLEVMATQRASEFGRERKSEFQDGFKVYHASQFPTSRTPWRGTLRNSLAPGRGCSVTPKKDTTDGD
jgi:hypothetical protein